MTAALQFAKGYRTTLWFVASVIVLMMCSLILELLS